MKLSFVIESKFIWPVSAGVKAKTPGPIEHGGGEGLVKKKV